MMIGHTSGNDRMALEGVIQEQHALVDPELGQLVLITEVRHSATGDVGLHRIAVGNPMWGNAQQEAEYFDRIATTDARGILGGSAVQYSLNFVREKSNGKACMQLPFIKAGSPQITGANGNLATEASPGQQSQRWGEIVLDGSIKKDTYVFQMLATLIGDLRKDNLGLLQESREWLSAFRQMLADMMEKQFSHRVELLRFERNSKLLLQGMRYAPAAMNAWAGREVVPVAVASQAFEDAVYDAVPPDMLEEFAAKLGERNAPGAAILWAKIAEIKKRRAEDAQEVDRLSKEVNGETIAEGMKDATADAIEALRGRKKDTNGGNGNGHTPKQIEAATGDDADLARFGDAFASLPPEEVETLAKLARMKGHDALAASIAGAHRATREMRKKEQGT